MGVEEIDLCFVDTFIGRLGTISVFLGSLLASGLRMSFSADPGTRNIKVVALRRC